jgi:hypothetical protein
MVYGIYPKSKILPENLDGISALHSRQISN